MFMGPLEAVKPWSMNGVRACGFLDRVWRMIVDDRAEEMRLNPAVVEDRAHGRTEPRAASDDPGRNRDIEKMSFNTAIARMMEFTNFFFKVTGRPKAAMEQFVLFLSPFAPHLAEELGRVGP